MEEKLIDQVEYYLNLFLIILIVTLITMAIIAVVVSKKQNEYIETDEELV